MKETLTRKYFSWIDAIFFVGCFFLADLGLDFGPYYLFYLAWLLIYAFLLPRNEPLITNPSSHE